MKYFIDIKELTNKAPIKIDSLTQEECQNYLENGYLLVGADYFLELEDCIYHINEEGQWIASFIDTLEREKEVKLAELKAERDICEAEPVLYKELLFDFDELSRERIRSAIITLEVIGDAASYGWTCTDNSEIEVTAEDLKKIIAVAGARSNKLHKYYRILKTRVMSVTSEDELILINWDTEEMKELEL